MALFELLAKIKLEGATEAKRGLEDVGAAAHKTAGALSSRLGGAIKDLGGNFADAAGKAALLSTAVAGAIGGAAFSAAAKMDSLTRGLASVSRDSADLTGQLARLREVAKLPGLGFEEAVQGSVSLQSAGLSAQLAERSLMAFGNALGSVGKGKGDLDGVTLALSQIASKGKVSAEEINQLNERVPQIRKAMQAAFGTSDTEAINKMGLSTTQFINGVVTQLERLPKVTGGIQNSIENLGDSVKQALVPLGQGIADMFMGASSSTESLISRLAGLGKMIGEAFSAIGRSGVLDEVFSSLQDRFGKIFSGNGLQQGIARFAGVALSILKNLPDTIQEIGAYTSTLFSAIGANLVKIAGFVWDSLKVIGKGVGEFLKGFGGESGGAGSGGTITGSFGIKDALKYLTSPGIFLSLRDGAERLGAAAGSGSGLSMPDLPELTALPALSGAFKTNPLQDADRFTAQILASLKPFSSIPDNLNFGGGGAQGGGMANVFADWDKNLAKIEANTKSTSDKLDPRRVFGGGELAKIGVTAAERQGSRPDPYTRSVDASLRSAIHRLVRADAMQTTRTMPLRGR